MCPEPGPRSMSEGLLDLIQDPSTGLLDTLAQLYPPPPTPEEMREMGAELVEMRADL